jgi:hypothetical protein
MGMWDETCGVTNLPIFPNDACVVVVLDAAVRELSGPLSEFEVPKHLKAVHRGTYDSYGWIDEVENNDEADSCLVLLFHRYAWDAIVAASKKLPKADSRDASEFAAILEFASTTRRDVRVGASYRGTQDSDSSDAYELLLELMKDGMNQYRESVQERG